MHPSTEKDLTHIGFTRIEPSKEHAELIENYWFINTNNHKSTGIYEHLHADGGHGIILNYEHSLSFNGIHISANSFFDGTNTASQKLGLHGVLNAVGIRFKPAGAAMYFSFPLKDIKNKVISLDDTNTPNHSELYDKVKEAHTLGTKVSVIEHWLSQIRNNKICISNSVLESLKFINYHRGTQPISLLEEHLGYSKRKIERLFNEKTGMTAKEYSTNQRLEFARQLIKSNNHSLTDITYQLGYYDQAHFINQFKNNIGITPGEYLMKHLNVEIQN